MKIYTRTGDKGETGFIGGRTSKASEMIQLLGELDELNAALGVAVSDLESVPELRQLCSSLQSAIFNLGAVVADLQVSRKSANEFPATATKEVRSMETHIDKLQSDLPELKNFILPGGTHAASQLHLARAICRRAERTCVSYSQWLSGKYKRNLAGVQKYLNRLADLLFVCARSANQALGESETVWKGH